MAVGYAKGPIKLPPFDNTSQRKLKQRYCWSIDVRCNARELSSQARDRPTAQKDADILRYSCSVTVIVVMAEEVEREMALQRGSGATRRLLPRPNVLDSPRSTPRFPLRFRFTTPSGSGTNGPSSSLGLDRKARATKRPGA